MPIVGRSGGRSRLRQSSSVRPSGDVGMIEAVAGQGGGRVVAEAGQQDVVAQAAQQVDEVRHAALGEVLEHLRHERQGGVAERGQLRGRGPARRAVR